MAAKRHLDSGVSASAATARQVSLWLLAVVALAAGRATAQTTPADWLGGDGSWTNAALWSTNPNYPNNGSPPGTIYAATIAAAASYVVSLNTAVTVNSLTLNAPGATLAVNSGSLTLAQSATLTAGAVQLNSGTITGGTFGGAGGVIRFNTSPGNVLNGVAIANAGMLDLAPTGSRVQLVGGTTVGPGTLPLGQNAIVHLNAATAASGASFLLGNNAFLTAEGGTTSILAADTPDVVTVTVNPGSFQAASIRTNLFGSVAGTLLVNRGTIRFDPAAVNATLTIAPSGSGGTFRNEGVLAVGGSNTVNLTGPFQNAGTFAVSGGTLNLGGGFTTAELGNFNRTGGAVNITGNLDNTGATLALSDAGPAPTGSLTLTDGGTITGGTVTAAGTARLRANSNPSNALVGVSLPAAALDLSAASSRVQLRGGTTVGPGAVPVGANAFVHLNQATAASGASFVLGSNAFLTAEGGTTSILGAATPDVVTVTINPGPFQAASIRTNFLGSVAGTVLVNRGTIGFDPASPGATLTIAPFGSGGTFRNEGVLAVGGSNTVNLTGPFQNAGTFAVGGGALNLAGDFSTANLGALNHTGGAVNVTGNLDNTGATLALSDAGPTPTGSITLTNNGTITGGTVTAAGTARLRADSSAANALVGVSLPAAALDLSAASSRVQLRGGTALGPGVVPVGANAFVHLNQATAASGASFVLGNNAVLTAEGGNTSVLGSAPAVVTVSVNPGAFQAARIHTNFFGGTAGTLLVNRGTIQFDPAATNATLNITPIVGGTFRNEGVLAVAGTNTST